MRQKGIWVVIGLAFVLRLYRLNFPLADWHSWRQADTSAVSRNFVKNGFDLLTPRYDDLSDIASKKDNPQGYRMVEFPIYNLLHAAAAKYLGIFSLEVWGRLISNIFACISVYLIYLIGKKYLNEITGLGAAFFYACLPFSIYYGRTVLPESMLVVVSLCMIYFYEHSLLFILSLSFALLIKPFSLVLIIPIWFLVKDKKKLLVKVLLAGLPFIAWRLWISQFKEGIPQNWWLFNGDGIRFKGAWFYWLFKERIGNLILGGWGLVLLGLGFVVKPCQKEKRLFHWWLVAILAYFTIVATGNVRHDYYQVFALPIICLFLAKGSYFLLTAPKEHFSRFTCYLLLVTCLLFSFAFSWYQVRDYFNVNNPAMVTAGQAVDRLVPSEAKVIAPYGGDTAFLYQTKRKGWPIGGNIEKKILQGADYYVSVAYDEETKRLMKAYCVLDTNSDWVIIDLGSQCHSI